MLTTLTVCFFQIGRYVDVSDQCDTMRGSFKVESCASYKYPNSELILQLIYSPPNAKLIMYSDGCNKGTDELI